ALAQTAPSAGAADNDGGQTQMTADAVSALVNLGYGRSEAFGAVAVAIKKLGEEAAVEGLIREGLAELSGGEAR
ncbi:MAG: Holliday junction branch migration protein RuvA, partial [Rhodospirillaceae bacterium]